MWKKVSRKKSDGHLEREARRRSREIDAMLVRTSQKPVAILLLGNCNSGISTFLKQMRIISGREYSHEELLKFRKIIYQNILQGMKKLLNEQHELRITLQNPANETLVESLDPIHMSLEPHTFQNYLDAINSFWKDAGIQEAYSKSVCCDYLVTLESVKYFMDNIDRIGQLSYVPSTKDVLYARKSWEADHYFVNGNVIFMTGQIWQWQKLFYYHQDTIIIFFVDSSGYDKVCYDANYLDQCLHLFRAVINNRRTRPTYSIILLLTKTDLLAEKVQTSDIRKHFPEFTGDPHSPEDVQRFLVQCFREQMGNDSRPLFYHFITAVDTENIRTVFNSVKDIIMQKNLKQENKRSKYKDVLCSSTDHST